MKEEGYLRFSLDSYENDSIGLMSLIRALIVDSVNTCEVVKVLKVDETKKELSVIPVVNNVYTNGKTIEETPIYGVKYIEWQYGLNAIQALPKVGDIGLILVSKRDISKIDSGIVNSKRKYSYSDSIYLGGLCGFNKTPTQFIKFDENGIEITSPTKIDIKAPTVNATMQEATINVSGIASITGGTVSVSGGSVSVSGSSVSIGSGSGEKAVCLDGDPVYNGNQQQIGTVRATSTVVKAN